jgi:deoxyribodipyrimidine photo-lyase
MAAALPTLVALTDARAAVALSKAGRVVLWLRSDLRTADSPVLTAAAASKAASVLPVVCFAPREHAGKLAITGLPKTSGGRSAFYREAAVDLRARLRALGSDLLVVAGEPEAVLAPLLQPGSVVLTHGECCPEERAAEARVEAAAAARGASLVRLRGGFGLYDERDVAPLFGGPSFATLPDVFTPFRNEVEAKLAIRAPLPVPPRDSLPLGPLAPELAAQLAAPVPSLAALGAAPAPAPHPRAALTCTGGETAALARVDYYLWQTDKVAAYFDTRNGLLGGDCSTKFEPWLSAGCLSARTVAAELTRYEAQRTANKSTYWVRFELLWRDYCRWFATKHGARIFALYGTARPAGNAEARRWVTDDALFQRWCAGTTGVPFVDANMRELAATGFMSNRGRQNVASYLALTLGLDWRLGAEFFESTLVGYDPASNWVNWAAAAAVTGGRVNRFNPGKQARDYDKDGHYVRAWLPELAGVPAPRCHEAYAPAQLSTATPRDQPRDMGAEEVSNVDVEAIASKDDAAAAAAKAKRKAKTRLQ